VAVARNTTKLDSARWEAWYWFLRQAIKLGLPYNETAYREWGTKAELEAWSFQKWWTIRGKEIARRESIKDSEVIEKTESTITIRFPLSMRSAVVKARASALVSKARGTTRIKKETKSSAFQYTTIKQLQRFLKVDLDDRYSELTLAQKGDLLRNNYQKLQKRHLQAITTYRKKADDFQKAGDREAASRYRRRAIALEEYKVANTDRWDPAAIKKVIELYGNKLERWAIQARLILFNTARGSFPGADWYGSKRNAAYKQALVEFGLSRVGFERNKGGGKDRGVAARKKREAERKRRGLKGGYGRGGVSIGEGERDLRGVAVRTRPPHHSTASIAEQDLSKPLTWNDRIGMSVAKTQFEKEKRRKKADYK
jgi:hypothetical protein